MAEFRRRKRKVCQMCAGYQEELLVLVQDTKDIFQAKLKKLDLWLYYHS